MEKADLELTPTDELVEELRRRSNGLLLVIDDNDDGNRGRLRVYLPSNPITALGMAEYARISAEEVSP